MSSYGQKKAIVVGASSGMGRDLAKVLSRNGYDVGLVARRVEELERLQAELPGRSHVRRIDVTEEREARQLLYNLILEMDGVELIVVNAGFGYGSRELDWEQERRAIEVNVLGFAAMAAAAFHYFCERGEGRLAGVSSIAGLRPHPDRPAYSASKAFVSNYLRSLRLKAKKLKKNIVVTDVAPGFVATPMLEGAKGLFWVASSERAAQEIFEAIEAGRSHAYITRRWRLIAWLMRLIPEPLYARI